MHIIVVGAGVTGIACAHNFLKRGHNVTLIEKASTPNQECSFGMAGFMGPISRTDALLPPLKAKQAWPPSSLKPAAWAGMYPSVR